MDLYNYGVDVANPGIFYFFQEDPENDDDDDDEEEDLVVSSQHCWNCIKEECFRLNSSYRYYKKMVILDVPYSATQGSQFDSANCFYGLLFGLTDLSYA